MLLKQLALLSGGLVGLTSAIPLINVLVLSTFDATGVENQVLRNNGFNVTGVSTSQFQSMSLEDLGRYNGIFISDAGVCDPNQLSFLDTATSEKLAKAVSGRIELIGTSLADERARRLAINASADLTDVENFALDAAYRLTQQPAIGLYLSLGCYYSNVFGNPATVSALSGFGTFAMRAPHQSPPSGCVSSDVTYRGGAQPVSFPDVTEAQLRAWQCAVREVFIDRPDSNSSGFDWIITSANAETPNPAPPGAPYVLGREMVAPACGNGWIDRAFNEECDFGLALNGLSNSNCGASCQCAVGVDTNGNCLPVPNVCGNGVVDTNSSNIPSIPSGVEQCDLGIQLNGQPGSTCDVNCQCVYGRTANNSTCAAAPVSSTTTTSATSTTTSGSPTSSAPTSSATSQSSTVLPTSTQSSSTGSPSTGGTSSGTVPPTSGQSSSTGTQSASPSSSVDPLPPRIGQFAFKACTGSVQNYPSFELQFSSNQMTLEMCIAGCAGSLYSGTHVNDCYCANAYDGVIEVARDRCSIPCPGNALENCGGYRGNSTNLLRRYDTRRQATGSVPGNALLAIYEYSPLATSSNTATTAPTTTAAPVPAAQSTSTGTTVVTAVATVTATPNGGGSCATGFCNAAGYFFELCQGGPRPGEVVFVIEACSCAGGFRYVPAGCSGTGCGSLVVYRAMPWTGGDNGTVYQPQACSSASGCAGGVVFQQNPPAPTANTTGVVVVVAGASKLAGYLSSAMAVGGSLLLAALL